MMDTVLAQAVANIPDWVMTAAAGGVGVFIGMKVSIARLEVWMKIRDGDILAHGERIGALNDDAIVFDQEIGQLCFKTGVLRVRRQELR